MPVDFAGAAVGAVLGQLLSLSKDGAVNVTTFRRRRKKIESILSDIYPIIQEISDHYERLGRQKEMDLIKQLMDEGEGLVNECKRIRWYKLGKLYKRSKKLTTYNATLYQRFQLFMLPLATRNGGETLTKMEEIREKLGLICSGQANSGPPQSALGALGNFAVPAAPAFTVGSEVGASMREIKLPSLEEGVSAIAVAALGGCGETTLLKKLCPDGGIRAQALSSSSCHPQDAETEVVDIHRAEEIQHLQMSNRSMTQNPKNMADHTITIQVEIGRDDDQWPQNQQQQQLQQGWPDLAIMFHVMFCLLKLLMIAHFRSLCTICQVIYLISLVEVTKPESSNQVYWYLYLIFGTLGFELLLWTNLMLVMCWSLI